MVGWLVDYTCLAGHGKGTLAAYDDELGGGGRLGGKITLLYSSENVCRIHGHDMVHAGWQQIYSVLHVPNSRPPYRWYIQLPVGKHNSILPYAQCLELLNTQDAARLLYSRGISRVALGSARRHLNAVARIQDTDRGGEQG